MYTWLCVDKPIVLSASYDLFPHLLQNIWETGNNDGWAILLWIPHDLECISFFLNRNENRLMFGFIVCVSTGMPLVPFNQGGFSSCHVVQTSSLTQQRRVLKCSNNTSGRDDTSQNTQGKINPVPNFID